MDDNDDAAPVAPAPQDPNPNSGGVEYDKEEGGGENNGGAMGGDGVGAPSSFAAMAGTMTTNSVVVQQPGGTSNVNDGGGDDEEGAVGGGGGGDGSMGSGGNLYLRPIFFGNLSHDCLATDVEKLFLTPPPPPSGGGGMDEGTGEVRAPFDLDRVDMKRGFCFVFLKDPPNIEEKGRCEDFVEEINGMNIPHVSKCLRAEFARGDGRIKRKEDERRKKIQPNDTLFVVNFHEETTKREDLQMLFEPYGELIRIDMKRNYAFVQFKSIDEAIRARDATNGGKLDQSEITVEFVARTAGLGGVGGDRGGGGRGRDDRQGSGGGGRRYDDRGGYRGGRGGRDDNRPRRGDDYRPRGGGGGGYRGDRYDDDHHRRGGGGGGGGYRDHDRSRRRSSRSRSRSPGYRRRSSRSRSPGYDRDYRSSRDEYRPSSRGGRDSYDDRERGVERGERADRGVERGYGRSEY